MQAESSQARLRLPRRRLSYAKVAIYYDTERVSAHINHCFLSVMPPGIFCHLPFTANFSVLPSFFL